MGELQAALDQAKALTAEAERDLQKVLLAQLQAVAKGLADTTAMLVDHSQAMHCLIYAIAKQPQINAAQLREDFLDAAPARYWTEQMPRVVVTLLEHLAAAQNTRQR